MAKLKNNFIKVATANYAEKQVVNVFVGSNYIFTCLAIVYYSIIRFCRAMVWQKLKNNFIKAAARGNYADCFIRAYRTFRTNGTSG
jgi:hypothetical protein